jgi:HAD superfamily hydrolase (TIGR01549 family)
MIKAVIFDFDGVLVESLDIKTSAFKELFNKYNKKTLNSIINYHLRNTGISRYIKFKHIYAEILKRPLSNSQFKILCKKFAQLVIKAVINAAYVRGAESFLERFKNKYKLFVVSATPEEELAYIIKRRKMSKYFEGISGAPAKKDEYIKEIMESYRLLPQEVVFIGDALSDYQAAKINGVNFIVRKVPKENFFENIDCEKINNLTTLSRALKILGKHLKR